MDHNYPCKSCGGCLQCQPCKHCGNCRNCGKPVRNFTYYRPIFIQPPCVPVYPNWTIIGDGTFGGSSEMWGQPFTMADVNAGGFGSFDITGEIKGD